VSDSNLHQLIERIHASGWRCVIAVTGGGSRAISDLLTVPGASASVLEAIVPYSAAALDEWLGGPIDQACSEPAARAMAMAAFERARRLSDAAPRWLSGIGATASLATNRPKRGPHRVHVAWQSAKATVAYSCELEKGARSRDEEETLAARLVLHAVAESCAGVVKAPGAPSPSEPITRREQRAPTAWTELLLGERELLQVLSGEAASAAAANTPPLVFPGAFNPLHAGHRRMAQIAAERVGCPVTLELAIKNVDKPSLDFIEIADRLAQLAEYPVILSRAATFAEKAMLLPGAVFIVGADTLDRIGAARYYGGNVERRDAAVAAIADHDCHFLVFGRKTHGEFRTLAQLVDLPTPLRKLCNEIPASEFRDDVSSTELRQGPADPS
jgi:nicotinic acid mononucleotide adenylyltransferase/nicotinamide mononucleotide (NMN) deamidase PncC